MCNFWLRNTRVTSVANDYSEHNNELINNRQCTITIISNKFISMVTAHAEAFVQSRNVAW